MRHATNELVRLDLGCAQQLAATKIIKQLITVQDT